jgi:Domain of unknown function (DUF1833)
MPRNVTVSIRKELEAEFSGEADLVFLTIMHGSLSEPIRVVWDTKDYVYDGNTFTGFPFDIKILSDDENPPRAELQIQNIDSRIGETLRSLQLPPRLKIEFLSSLDFDTSVDPRVEWGGGSPGATVVYSADHCLLVNVKVDFITVTGEIRGWDYLQRVWPGKRAIQSSFPGLFR